MAEYVECQLTKKPTLLLPKLAHMNQPQQPRTQPHQNNTIHQQHRPNPPNLRRRETNQHSSDDEHNPSQPQHLLRNPPLPTITARVRDRRKRFPPHVGGTAPVEDDGVVFADAGDADVEGEEVPELAGEGVGHGVPGLVGVLWVYADEALEELVAAVCEGEAGG